MGLVCMGPPTELILQLRDRYELMDFVETGTYLGDTSVWAAFCFDNVTTVECAREIYEETIARHGKIQNINFVLGDSKSVLGSVIPKLTRPAIFWLDSHWSGGKTYGERDECPLIEEIQQVNLSKYTHFIFIDDARLFTSPPPQPHCIQQWPAIDKVIKTLESGKHQYYIVILEDVIIAVPDYAKGVVAGYCQKINTGLWEEYSKHLSEPALRQGYRLISQGFGLVLRGLHVQMRHLVLRNAKRVVRK